jgi:hypothetical protein
MAAASRGVPEKLAIKEYRWAIVWSKPTVKAIALIAASNAAMADVGSEQCLANRRASISIERGSNGGDSKVAL